MDGADTWLRKLSSPMHLPRWSSHIMTCTKKAQSDRVRLGTHAGKRTGVCQVHPGCCNIAQQADLVRREARRRTTADES